MAGNDLSRSNAVSRLAAGLTVLGDLHSEEPVTVEGGVAGDIVAPEVRVGAGGGWRARSPPARPSSPAP